MSQHTVTRLIDAAGRLRALEFPSFSLSVVHGPDAPRTVSFEASERVLLGSGEGPDLALTDPTVSATHCELVLDESGLKVVDLGSKNGVLLLDRRVSSAWLHDGDELALGNTRVKVRFGERRHEHRVAARTSFGALIGGSLPMRRLYDELERVAKSDLPVLLIGDTGTGKATAAETIIAAGPRAQQPVIVFSCGAVAAGTFESELFGHVKGAFTGATTDHAGVFLRAHGGTLILDKVNELPIELQPRLLRVLESKKVQPVGGTAAVPFDARVISTAQRPLEPEVNRGAFRADLFFRLGGVTLRLPPLSERSEDIPQLVSHFLSLSPLEREVPPAVLRQLIDASYPGNVRELKSAVERAVLGLEVATEKAMGDEPLNLDQPFYPQRDRIFASLERAYLKDLLELCKGNVSKVSRRSGIARVHLYTLLRKHRLLGE